MPTSSPTASRTRMRRLASSSNTASSTRRRLAAAQRAGILRADVEPRTAALFVLGGVQKLALHALDGAKRARIDLGALALEATKLNMLGLLSDEVPR